MSPAHPENWPVLTLQGAVDEQLLRDVRTLVAAAEESDGNPPLSEQTLVTLRAAAAAPQVSGAPAGPHGNDLAGVAVVIGEPDGGAVLEVAVHPTYRNQGVAD